MPLPTIGPPALRVPNTIDNFNGADDDPGRQVARIKLESQRLITFDPECGLDKDSPTEVRAHRPVLDILAEMKNGVRPRLAHRYGT